MRTLDFESEMERLVETHPQFAANGRIAQHAVPDVRMYIDAKGLIRYYSPAVNEKVDNVWYDIANNVVYMMPFIVESGVAINSDPPMICVGRVVDNGWGIQQEPGWEEIMAQFPDVITKKTKLYLEKHPAIFW